MIVNVAASALRALTALALVTLLIVPCAAAQPAGAAPSDPVELGEDVPQPDPAPTPTAAPTGTEQEAQLAEARERFMQGLELARNNNCEGAIPEFEASYAITPRPNTLYNIARCQEQLNRYDLAIRYYEQYLASAPADDEDRPTVEATMRALQNLLGVIVVRSNVAAEVWVGGRVVGAAPGEVPIPGGRHRVEVRADGYIPIVREVEVTARSRVEVEVELERPQQTTIEQTTIEQTVVEDRGIAPGLFYGGLALTGATAVVGAGFGIRALIRRSDQRAVHPLAGDEMARLREQAKSSARIADVFFLTAGVLAVGTTVVFFLTDFSDEEDAPASDAGVTARLRPLVGRRAAGFTLDGSF